MSVDSREAGIIHLDERDYFLQLQDASWGKGLPKTRWARLTTDGCTRRLMREIPARDGSGAALQEHILRFPSAPIYSVHRKRDYQNNLHRVNHHTLRLLLPAKPTGRLRRLFLMHNGLNEIDDMAFYYRLADSLLSDGESGLIIRPFPGHLSRFPFPMRYAETPLSRYLNDSGDLFRQFLRFMLETQWLLSALVPLPRYRVVAGLNLLAEQIEEAGREDVDALSRAIAESWNSAFDASAAVEAGDRISAEGIESDIRTLRELVQWEARMDRPSDEPPSADELVPFLHAIGYSLGGYLAQSVFFTWPYAVSSCTTMLSGGALRDLALTSFAQPEEWQSIMHALRFEVESSMLQGRFKRHDNRIAGVETDAFTAFHRMFYEVFLQDWRSTHHTRMSEYIARLMHFVGGADPIISKQAVLDATPSVGINSLQIANLTHFPERPSQEWHEFWLPQVARLTREFAARTESILTDAIQANWQAPAPEHLRKDPTEGRPPSRRNEGLLASRDYGEQLDDVTDILTSGGWVFILRNRVPAALLGRHVIKLNQVIHHEDSEIRHYVRGLSRRGEVLWEQREHVTLILPTRQEKWFKKEGAILPGKVEVPTGHVATPDELGEIWNEFISRWGTSGALRFFDPARRAHAHAPAPRLIEREIVRDPYRPQHEFALTNTLPNVWVSLTATALHDLAGGAGDQRENVEWQFAAWADRLYDGHDELAQRQLSEWLSTGALRIIRVSAADLNPRFMGQRVLDERMAIDLITHSALAYCYSRPRIGVDTERRSQESSAEYRH